MKICNALFVLFIILCLGVKAQRNVLPESGDSSLFVKSTKLQKVIIKFPENYDPSKDYPLLVALHGNGGTAVDIASVFQGYKNKQVIIAFPQGQYPRIIDKSIGYSWYYFTNNINISDMADLETIDQITTVINEIKSLYKTDKTVILGFSQGASLAYLTGFRHPDLVSGIISIGGGMPQIGGASTLVKSSDIEKSKPIKILVSRGKKDRVNKKESYKNQIDFLEGKGFLVTGFEYDGGHYLTNEIIDKVFSWIDEIQAE